MKLLIDQGNTRLKWCWAGAGTADASAFEHAGRAAADLVAALPEPSARLEEIRIASVAAPALAAALAAALHARFGLVPRFAVAAPAAGRLRNGYRDPRQLGVDRWLAMRATLADDAPVARCVVAAGTAFTLDLVGADGQHAGGLIVPGIEMMGHALYRGTGNLAELAAADPVGAAGDAGPLQLLVARATGEGISLGSAWALSALVIHHFARLQAHAGGARLFVSGGDARRLMPLLPVAAEYRPHLVLEGLDLDPFFAGPAPGLPG
jgi:type III pantothenate kinase